MQVKLYDPSYVVEFFYFTAEIRNFIHTENVLQFNAVSQNMSHNLHRHLPVIVAGITVIINREGAYL